VTTATKKRSTKKSRAKKKKVKKTKAKTKKPKWTLVTYKQIEAGRKKIGLSKSALEGNAEITVTRTKNGRTGRSVAPGSGTNGANASGRRAASAPQRGISPGSRGESDGGTEWSDQPSHTANVTPVSLLLSEQIPRHDAIAAITVAFIGSQEKPPSAGSVVEFVRELGAAL
jgi:hypothetical protein